MNYRYTPGVAYWIGATVGFIAGFSISWSIFT